MDRHPTSNWIMFGLVVVVIALCVFGKMMGV